MQRGRKALGGNSLKILVRGLPSCESMGPNFLDLCESARTVCDGFCVLMLHPDASDVTQIAFVGRYRIFHGTVCLRRFLFPFRGSLGLSFPVPPLPVSLLRFG